MVGTALWVTGQLDQGHPRGRALTLPPPDPQALPPSGIHIFASQLHTHLTGRKVVTVLARDGRERAVVNRDNHYSPHFQVGARLPPGLSGLPSPDSRGNAPVPGSCPGQGPDTWRGTRWPALPLGIYSQRGTGCLADCGNWGTQAA